MRNLLFVGFALVLINYSCTRNKLDTDASGVFESDEVIVSAEQSGKIVNPITGTVITKYALEG